MTFMMQLEERENQYELGGHLESLWQVQHVDKLLYSEAIQLPGRPISYAASAVQISSKRTVRAFRLSFSTLVVTSHGFICSYLFVRGYHKLAMCNNLELAADVTGFNPPMNKVLPSTYLLPVRLGNNELFSLRRMYVQPWTVYNGKDRNTRVLKWNN